MRKTALVLITVLVLCLLAPVNAQAAGAKEKSTGLEVRVKAVGQYINWDGVPSVCQFTDENGR